MKKLILVILLICLFMTSQSVHAKSWTDNWTLNGIPLSKFKDADGKEYAQLAGGVVTSFVTHWVGHVIFLETHNKNWYQDGLNEVCTSSLSNSEGQWFGRSGIVFQLVVGTGLKFSKYNDSFFATGYHLGSFIEITTYPLIHKGKGDFHFIDKYGGNADLEYGLYTIWSGLLLLID